MYKTIMFYQERKERKRVNNLQQTNSLITHAEASNKKRVPNSRHLKSLVRQASKQAGKPNATKSSIVEGCRKWGGAGEGGFAKAVR